MIISKIIRHSFFQFLLIFGSMTVVYATKASGQNFLDKEISISVESERLENVLSIIEKKSEAKFVYSSKVLEGKTLVSLKVEKEKLNKVLLKLFTPLNLTYEVADNRIILSPNRGVGDADIKSIDGLHNKVKSSTNVTQDRFEIRGSIKDVKGDPLIGANVLLKGTTKGTTTDVDGNFSFFIETKEKNGTIEVSYVGYEKTSIAINGRNVINAVLKSMTSLDEVVVIGYGEVKKRDYIGSVGTVGAKELSNQAITSYSQALAGQIANVEIRQGTGVPGGGPEFIVRGINSISPQSAPLIVIDDIPYGNYSAERDNFLTMINPDDIESISVIKDASGKAIYGSRAANGLVIIKTKRGRIGEPTISYSTTLNFQTIPSWEKPDVMSASELAQFHKERFDDDFFILNKRYPIVDEVPLHLRNPESYGKGTDWFDALTRNAWMQNHNVSVRGGNQGVTYAVNFGYLNQEGVVIESNLKRYSLRANFDATIKPWLKFSMDLAPSWTDNTTGNTDPGSGQFSVYNVLNIARWADPTGKIYDNEGNLSRDTKGVLTQFFQVNPVRYLEEQRNNKDNRSLQGSIGLSAEIIKGLTLKTKASTYYFNNKGRSYEPSSIRAEGLEPAFNNLQASINTGRYENLRLLSETQLLYNKKIKKHSFDGLLAYTGEFTQETTFGSNTSRLIDENFQLIFKGNIPTSDPNDPERRTQIFFGTSEGIGEQALISYLGRLQYNFDEKYYVTASARRDGSSRFGPDNQWGFFPSGALAYRISKEKWFPKNNILNDAKLEISAGVSGNNRIGNYAWRGTVGGADYVIGGTRIDGNTVTGLPNPFLKWEETNQLDLGLDLTMFKKKLDIEIDLYRSVTEDLLFGTTTPRVTGFGSRISNLGSIENKGIEFSADYKAIIRQSFSWSIKGNIGINRNKVLRIGEFNNPILTIPAGNGTNAGIIEVGSPIGMFRGLKITGLYTADMIKDESVPKYPGAVEGAPIYDDFDGDGFLDRNKDIQIIGNPWADFTYGMTHNFIFKNFNARIIFVGSQGGKILNLAKEFGHNTDKGAGELQGVFNLDRDVLDRWRVGSTDYTIRVPTTTSVASSQRWRWPGSAGLSSGSFLKISNININYNLTNVIKKIKGLKGLTIGLTGQNLYYFKSFKFNPEARRATGGPLERNVFYSAYPTATTYTFNFNLTL